MRILAIVSYLGTNYAGWQFQPEHVSIQETIEQAISKIRNTPTKIYGSGRTDAGVHALGQTFHFDIDEERDLEKFRYSINCVLPKDIHILSLTKVNDDFHARLSAKGKVYQYVINRGEHSVFNYQTQTEFDEPLDVDDMRKCASIFEGKHCYQNFTTKEEDEDGFVREISSISIEENHDKLVFTFTGNGFMRYMIRFLVGTLLQVGKGKLTLDEVKKALDSSERRVVSYKAEPQGLTLVKVIY